jgi:serine phosphatase RsbU (regulator of sigma subunit)
VAARFEQILEEHTIVLHDDDVFVFYTDGITEAMNGTADLFGDERLVEVLSQSGGQCAAAISQRIQDDVAAFVDGADPHDDMTMVVVRISGAGAPVAA